MNREARRRVVERLSQHARHHPMCASSERMDPDEYCDCGVADLRRALLFALLGHVVGGLRDPHSGRYSCLCGNRTADGCPAAELDAFARRHEHLGMPPEHEVDDAIRRALAKTPARAGG